MANLNLVYENRISLKQKKEIIKFSYRNLVYSLFEFLENSTLNKEEMLNKIEEDQINIHNEEILLNAINNNRKIIITTAHFGNWEYLMTYLSLKYKPLTIIAKKMNNDYLNKDLLDNRSKHNLTMLTSNNSAKGTIKTLKEGNLLGLATDQHIKSSSAEKIKFLDIEALQANTTARLSKKFDAVIIPVFFVQHDFKNYSIFFHEPIDPLEYKGDNWILDATQKEADIMTQEIRLNPKNWFWQHKRFKSFNKEIY